jgi:hypothetical protein
LTTFPDLTGKQPMPQWVSLHAFGPVIATTTAATREALPLLSLARFGGKRTAKGSRRHDSNIKEHSGAILDVDGGLPLEEVARRFHAAGIAALIYGTPSGRPDRCRVVLPFSVPRSPSEHATMVGRAASLLEGATVDPASWSQSQAYYYGVPVGRPVPAIVEVDGANWIDLRDDLPVVPRPAAPAATARAKAAKVNGENKGNGADPDPTENANHNFLRTEFRRRIVEGGQQTHQAMTQLAGVLASEGYTAEEIEQALIEALKERPFLARNQDWHGHLDDAPRIAEWAAGREDHSQDWPQTPAQTGTTSENGQAEEPPTADPWELPPPPEPDLSVLHLNRRPPPAFPLEVLGDRWAEWARVTAEASSAPVDYVVAPLLVAASALIGNARWAQGKPGWEEPPVLWAASVGDSGDGKSPGADTVMGKVVPALERKMRGDYPDRHREWAVAAALAAAKESNWRIALAKAQARGNELPSRPADLDPGPEPQMPRLRQHDVTVEKVAQLLATASPKGLVIVRDELAAFLLSMTAYNEAGRQFWLESYGGRPHSVERVKLPEPLHIPHFSCALFGTIQPERLAAMMAGVDDGFLSRLLFCWPDPVPFRLNDDAPDISFAVTALDRLRLLEMHRIDDQLHPIVVPLVPEARQLMADFANHCSAEQKMTEGLLRSAYGKARGLALRLSLVLEHLRWAVADFDVLNPGPPSSISVESFKDAVRLVAGYFLPMAERTYGDAAVNKTERGAALLARWIVKERIRAVHTRPLQRKVRLPGLTDAEAIHEACQFLVEAGWLLPGMRAHGKDHRRATYPVNPTVWEALGAHL